jgi:L-serine dehydratase
MGAAMAAEAPGVQVASNAPDSALEDLFGTKCDPVGGYVHVPCIERCAFRAVKSWTAYCIASNEIETKRRVDLDTCIAGMAMTAKDRNTKYKETSDAAVAALVLC